MARADPGVACITLLLLSLLLLLFPAFQKLCFLSRNRCRVNAWRRSLPFLLPITLTSPHFIFQSHCMKVQFGNIESLRSYFFNPPLSVVFVLQFNFPSDRFLIQLILSVLCSCHFHAVNGAVWKMSLDVNFTNAETVDGLHCTASS